MPQTSGTHVLLNPRAWCLKPSTSPAGWLIFSVYPGKPKHWFILCIGFWCTAHSTAPVNTRLVNVRWRGDKKGKWRGTGSDHAACWAAGAQNLKVESPIRHTQHGGDLAPTLRQSSVSGAELTSSLLRLPWSALDAKNRIWSLLLVSSL
jgi:hypothetical protein